MKIEKVEYLSIRINYAYKKLKTRIRLWISILKVRGVIRFNQKVYLKQCINTNADLRK